MEDEYELYHSIKKYLERLGYPPNCIVPEFKIPSGKRVDIAVKTNEGVLLAIEVRGNIPLNLTPEELGYHPLSRQLQKTAEEIDVKNYMLSNGKQHIWLQTGKNGRPEVTSEIKFSSFDADSLSNFQFTKFILGHVFEYITNFPITGDTLFDNSVILYLKLSRELFQNNSISFNLKDFIGNIYISESRTKSDSTESIIEEALRRLNEVRLLENQNAVIEFIDEYFETFRREWSVPRWLADFMVKLLMLDKTSLVVDVFAKKGTITFASYSNDYSNVLSCYTNQQDVFWIKIHQLLGIRREAGLVYEPGLLRGELDFLTRQTFDGVLLAPPFNLKFESFQHANISLGGSKDSNSLYIGASLESLRANGKVIAIVMDGFLLSSSYTSTRAYLNEVGTIEAIISLPTDTFKPYSATKTSLIVLRRKPSPNTHHTFFASIDKIPKKKISDCREDREIDQILLNFESFQLNSYHEVNKNGFIVPNLDIENFHFSKYWFERQQGNSSLLDSDFTSIPLKQLVYDISRGSAIVKDSVGDIPFVSPGSVRSLFIKKEEIAYTSNKRLPSGNIRRLEKNDVIVNIIGPYRGKAALSTSEVIGFPINRHLIAIRPNTSLITPEYLAIALNSKYVQEQFLDKSSGSVIQSLNLKSFEEIFIPVPSIEKQESIYHEYKRLQEELAKIKIREADILSELNNKLQELGKRGGEL